MPQRGKGKNENNVRAWTMGNSSIVFNYIDIRRRACHSCCGADWSYITVLSVPSADVERAKKIKNVFHIKETFMREREREREKHGKYITALLMSQDVPSLEFRHFFKKDYLKEERSPMEFHREKYRKGKKKFLLTKWSKGLTFAGIRGSFWSTGVLVEAPLTAMAVTALCVVEAVITHTPAPST